MQTVINLILTYKYLIIFPLAVIEGPFLCVVLGYLIFAGYINWLVTFLVVLAADIGPDIFYWRLGLHGNKKILESKYFAKSEKAATNLQILENMWHKHTKKTMFFGKLAYGIALPIIISAGVAKLPLKKFVLASLPVGIFQIGLLLFVGYHLGTSYELAGKYVKYPGIIIAIMLLLIAVLYILGSKYFAKLFKKAEGI